MLLTFQVQQAADIIQKLFLISQELPGGEKYGQQFSNLFSLTLLMLGFIMFEDLCEMVSYLQLAYIII